MLYQNNTTIQNKKQGEQNESPKSFSQVYGTIYGTQKEKALKSSRFQSLWWR